MVYKVPASRAGFKQNIFEFSIPGSKKIHKLPKVQFAPYGILASAYVDPLKPTTDENLALLVNLGVDRDQLFTLSIDQLEDLITAWGAESGEDLGESGTSAEK